MYLEIYIVLFKKVISKFEIIISKLEIIISKLEIIISKLEIKKLLWFIMSLLRFTIVFALLKCKMLILIINFGYKIQKGSSLK